MRVRLKLQTPEDYVHRKKKPDNVIPAKPIKKRETAAPKQSDRSDVVKAREES